MARPPSLTDSFTLAALSHLSAPKAFQAQCVCRRWLGVVQRLDAKALVLSWRPAGWLLGAASAPCLEDASFCRALLRDLHTCLADSALQVAYITWKQHLIFIEPTAKLASPPQGGDVFPVGSDRDHYTCRIVPFSQNKVWWSCLEGEAFYWPLEDEDEGTRPATDQDNANETSTSSATPPGRLALRTCEAVPGFGGSSDAFRLPEDVAAVLALNAAWYKGSFMNRKLQTILLLRDGRFALLGSCEDKGSIDSHARGYATRCLVADSLANLVTHAQDDFSRRLLRTQLPCKVSRSATPPDNHGSGSGDTGKPDVAMSAALAGSKFSRQVSAVALPRSPLGDILGHFLTSSAADAKWSEPPLFDKTMEKESAANVQPGDEVRVLHEGLELKWSACTWPDNDLAQGPVDPERELKLLAEAEQKGLRFLTYSAGCTVGRDRRFHYPAVVQTVDRMSSTADVLYTTEATDGNSGFTGSLGRMCDAELPPTQETDVAFHRIHIVPKSPWFQDFLAAWKPCGAFVSLNSSFEDSENDEDAQVAEDRGTCRVFSDAQVAEDRGACRVFGASSETGDKDSSSATFAAHRLCRVADAFRDSRDAHTFRLQELSTHRTLLVGSLQEEKLAGLLAASPALGSLRSVQQPLQMWPRQAEMELGKRLFLELLRHPSYWPIWQTKGGESSAHIAKLFKQTKFVRLVLG